MHAPAHESDNGTRRPLQTVAAIYIAWTIISWLFFWAGRTMAADGSSARLLIPVWILLHIGMAALATAAFVVRVLPTLQERPRLRLVMIFCCIGVSIGGWLYSRWTQRQLPPVFFMVNTANLLIFANLVGTWITKPLKRPAELVPISVVMVLADLFSVFKGPSKQIAETVKNYYETGMQGPPPAAEFILVKIAVPGLNAMLSVFGLADWIIVAFFTAATVKFGFNDNLFGLSAGQMLTRNRVHPYLPITAIGLFIAVMLAHLLNVFLPALPVVALSFMGYIMAKYSDARRLTSSDWRITGIAIGVMSALMAVYGYF